MSFEFRQEMRLRLDNIESKLDDIMLALAMPEEEQNDNQQINTKSSGKFEVKKRDENDEE